MSADARNTIASIIFRIVQLVLLPFATPGYVLWVVKLIIVSRKSGVSATVLASLYTRWMQHKLGTRRDDYSERLMRVLPNVPHFAFYLVTSPTLVAHRLTAYVPRVYRYPYEGEPPMKDQPAARTTFFDAALDRHIADVDQLVILGAGFDTRAYRLPAASQVRSFELDAPRTQAFKREMLSKAGVDTARVTYVSADFLKEDWLEKLADAGFHRDKRSFFLWEAVTMYLDREAVESTLRKIGGMAGGSVVAFDYLSAETIESQSLYMRYIRTVLRATGEPWRFGIDSSPPVRKHIATFLASCGLSLEEQRNFGQETDRKHALAGFVTAVV